MDEKLRLVTKPVELNLMGLGGNVFVLLGAFQQAALRQHTPKEEISAVMKEATIHNYDHTVQVLLANTIQTENNDYEDDFENEDEIGDY